MSPTEAEPVEGALALDIDPVADLTEHLDVSDALLKEQGIRGYVKTAIEWRETALEGIKEDRDLPGTLPTVYEQGWFQDIGEAYRYFMPLAANVSITVHGPVANRIGEANQELAGLLLELWDNPTGVIPGDSRVEAFLVAQLVDKSADLTAQDVILPLNKGYKTALGSARAVIRRLETQFMDLSSDSAARAARARRGVNGSTKSGKNINLAKCREPGVDTSLFFPDSNRTFTQEKKTRQAKEICSTCELKGDCLERALGFYEKGDGLKEAIYGGTTKAEREVIRAQRREELRQERLEQEAKEQAEREAEEEAERAKQAEYDERREEEQVG